MKIQLVVQKETIKELIQSHIESLVTIKDSAEVELTFTKQVDVIVDISTGTKTEPKKEKVAKETKKVELDELDEDPQEETEEEPTLGNNPLFKEPNKEKNEEKKSSPAQGLFAKLSQANNK